MSIIQVPLPSLYTLSLSLFILSVSLAHSQDMKAGVAAQQIFAAGHENLSSFQGKVKRDFCGGETVARVVSGLALHRVALAGP